MDRIQMFVVKLREVVELIEQECNSIDAGKVSKWNKNQLENAILPEIQEILTFALKGEILFKYGKRQRLLVSTYILSDSLENLCNISLGEKIIELQKMYDSF